MLDILYTVNITFRFSSTFHYYPTKLMKVANFIKFEGKIKSCVKNLTGFRR